MEAYITEAVANEQANTIKVHIYNFPLENQDERYKGVSEICRTLKWKNKNNVIVYRESSIMAIAEIRDMASYEAKSYDCRVIDEHSNFEKGLLEQLIKASLIKAGTYRLDLKQVGYDLQKKQPEKAGEVLVYPALTIHVNIIANKIHIGFNLTHKFEYMITLQQMIERNEMVKDQLELVDTSNPYSNYTYFFDHLADYGVYDNSPLMNQSIVEYFTQKGQKSKISQLSENTKVAHVKTREGKIIVMAAQFLKPVCSYSSMKTNEISAVNKVIKLKPLFRMKQTMEDSLNILNSVKYLTFSPEPFLAKNNGYEIKKLKDSSVLFDKPQKWPIYGLKNGGIYRGGKMTLSLFVDETALNEPVDKILVYKYFCVLKEIARKHGVVIDISSQTKSISGKLNQEFFKNFDWQIKEHEAVFKNTTVLAVLSSPHLELYEPFKKQFGGSWDISSQVISVERLKEFQKMLSAKKEISFNPNDDVAVKRVAITVENDKVLSYTFYNVLLGLYVKSGMQPWVLNEKTNSDCFIGLDVSHEKGRSTAGIINVIGNDGRLIKQSAVGGANTGEKVSDELLRDTLNEVLHKYKVQFDTLPKHVTIHRDGFWRENTGLISEMLGARGIQFDIVEVIKSPQRRMAYYDLNTDTMETRQGTYYFRGKEALLCATNPREKIGMALPIKVVQKTNTLSFEQIISDVYALSFMHVHALNKTRLPATTHYADLSSTFYQRGMVAARSTNETHLPFV